MNFKRSDQVIALRRITKAVEEVYGKMDRAAVERHAVQYPGSVGPEPRGRTARRTANVLDALKQAKDALALIDGAQ